MGSELGEILKIREDLIKKSCSLSLQVQNFPNEVFRVEELPGSSHVVFSFPGSWSVDSWYAGEKAFGETEINLASESFPSMKSIGNYAGAKPEEREFATAFVNKAFIQKFERVLQSSQIKNQVKKAIDEGKSIIFTGHSTGGATAALATIWFLENFPTAHNGKFLCVTFGSPLVGNHIISHALRRENWSQYFIHFVMRYDIVPRILLAPLSSIKQEFEKIPHFFDPNSPDYRSESLALDLYTNVMGNASSVTSHVASKLTGSTNLLLETVTNFIKLSPYRPFGTYVFCTGNGKLVVLKNPEAVFQLLFFSCQLSSETERTTIAVKCLNDHLAYEVELEDSFNMQNVTPGDDKLVELALGPDSYFDDLGLSVRARLCLRAAGQVEKQKKENQNKIIAKKDKIKDEMKKLQDYQAQCEHNGGYYNAFKLQKDPKDFQANVTRLVLAGIWDEIMEMLKIYELPDEFEAIEEWITLGNQFRDLVEPLDIANYYRHSKDEDSGPYMKKGRPKRYKYTQGWLEYQQKKPAGSLGQSYYWAEQEELHKHK